MGVVTTLLKQVPAAAKFKSKLEALDHEVSQLRAENARLREDLAQYINQWETLDGPQVSVMQYLAAHAQGHAKSIAKTIGVNIQIAETGLVFMVKCGYVHEVNMVHGVKAARTAPAVSSAGKAATYALTPKGVRYLRDRGLDK